MTRLLLFIFSLFLSFSTLAHTTPMSYRLACLAADESRQQEKVAVLILGNVNQLKELIPASGGVVKSSSGNILSATVPVSALKALASSGAVKRMEEGRLRMQQLNDRMRINNNINAVHQGIAPLPQGYDGKDVVVGIIDTGIDFSHPDFKDSLGHTRILWIWDHLLADSANTPAAFGYGQEFSAADIDAGLASAHVDQTAHGTHVSGIAAGNGMTDTIFKGAAPAADIIAVSVDLNLADDVWLSTISDAVEYIFNKADSLNKPCVINISAGTYFGSHDGKDLSAQYIDNLITAKNGRMVVAAAGNAGNYPLHVQHNPVSDSVFTWYRYTSGGIYIEFWGDTTDMSTLQFGIGANEVVTFNDRGILPFTDVIVNDGILSTDTLYSYSGNRLALVQRFSQIIDDRFSMIFFITPDSGSCYFRAVTAGTGTTDCWSFDMLASGLPPGTTKYAFPDFNQTICSSFQCSDIVITTGQYVNRNNYVDVNNNLQTFPLTEGALAASSSHGPTRDGRTKPDITSTGEYTMAPLQLSAQAWFLANQPFKLAKGGKHIRDGGTSSAAPAISGIIALYLQKNPNADWQDIRNRILLCSNQDAFTGATPNNGWGHGKADAFKAITGCVALGVNESINKNDFQIWPNPAATELNIDAGDMNVHDLTVINILGQEIMHFEMKNATAKFKISKLSTGIYFIRINSDVTLVKRFIKE